jgi:hypothetical protein
MHVGRPRICFQFLEKHIIYSGICAATANLDGFEAPEEGSEAFRLLETWSLQNREMETVGATGSELLDLATFLRENQGGPMTNLIERALNATHQAIELLPRRKH